MRTRAGQVKAKAVAEGVAANRLLAGLKGQRGAVGGAHELRRNGARQGLRWADWGEEGWQAGRRFT